MLYNRLVLALISLASSVEQSDGFFVPNRKISSMRTLQNSLILKNTKSVSEGERNDVTVAPSGPAEENATNNFLLLGDDDNAHIDELFLELEESRLKDVESEQRIASLEAQVENYELMLDKKDRMLEGGRHKWITERDRFFNTLANLAWKIEEKEEELLEQQETQEEEIQDEISNLKAELKVIQENLDMERAVSNETKRLLQITEDSLKAEQLKYQKEKTLLTDRVRVERERLSEIEKQKKEQHSQYEQEKNQLSAKIDHEKSKITKTENSLKSILQKFEQQQEQLKAEFDRLKNLGQEKQKEIKQNTERFSKERREQKSQLNRRRKELNKVEKMIKKQDRQLTDTVKDLETQLVFEKVRFMEMTDELEEEGIRFREENDLIQTKINEESGKLAKLEEELEKTIGKFDKKRNDWDHKLLEVERVGRLKARQMNNRCEAIRKEMNKLIETTKRQGEKEHTSIVRQYEKKISAVDSTILELKQALVLSSQETLQFENRLETVTRQRDSANLENYVTEHRYIQAIASRNKEISSLKRDTLNLEHNKEEREGKIQRYESSYQELAKLTVKLARKRMAKKSPRKWITAVCRRRGSASGQKKNTADFLSSISSSSPSSTLLDDLDKIEP